MKKVILLVDNETELLRKYKQQLEDSEYWVMTADGTG